MQKTVLILIIVVILIAIGIGIFLLAGNTRPGVISPTDPQGNNNTQNPVTQPQTQMLQGMKVETIKQGTGVGAANGNSVTVHYVGYLPDGKKFDSSVDRNAPFTFKLGAGNVIKGWDLGVAGMKVGEKRKLTIPPELAYGSSSFLMIPANATLTFEVEVLRITQ